MRWTNEFAECLFMTSAQIGENMALIMRHDRCQATWVNSDKPIRQRRGQLRERPSQYIRRAMDAPVNKSTVSDAGSMNAKIGVSQAVGRTASAVNWSYRLTARKHCHHESPLHSQPNAQRRLARSPFEFLARYCRSVRLLP